MPLKALSIIFVCLLSVDSFAKDPVVFDIRRPFAMKNGEVNQKDYFINQGSNHGIKINMVITVNRRLTMYDSFTNKTPGDLVMPIGKLRIIHVQDNLSVARLEKMEKRAYLPQLDYNAIMVGDRLDLNTAKVMRRRRTAAVDIKFEKLEASEPTEIKPIAPSIPYGPQLPPAQNSTTSQ